MTTTLERAGGGASGWNRAVLIGLSVLLVLAGIFGFFIPPELAFTSGAAPYNVFHLIFGLGGGAVAARGTARQMAAFNFGFGLIDLYQALAGVTGLFPSRFFQLQTGDHVIHLLLGAFLAIVGWCGLRAGAPRWAGASSTSRTPGTGK